MYCPECGTKNSNDSIFCSECGTKLGAQTLSEQQVTTLFDKESINIQQKENVLPNKPKKPISKIDKIILGEILVLIIAIMGFFYIGKHQFSPEKVAEQHFQKTMNGDWEGVYDDFDIVESDFISKKQFVNTMEYQGATKYSSYKLEDNDENHSGISTNVDISYRPKGDSSDSTYSVPLIKQSSKSFLFFDKWKVSPSDYVYKAYTIEVPSDVSVTLDGIQLDSSYLNSDSNDSYDDYYIIPELFTGEHNLKITQENMNDVDTTITTADGGYYLESMVLKDSIKEDLVKGAGEAMQTIYKAAFHNSTFSAISNLFVSDTDQQSNMEDSYNSFLQSFSNYDGTGIENINFSNVSGTIYQENENGILYVHVTLDYNYDLEYTHSDWWTGDIESDTYSDIDQTEFVYVFENGKWILYSTNFNNLYYY